MTAVHSSASSPPASRPFPFPRISRNVAIVGGVLVFHGAVLWAIQSGLVRKVAEVVVPIEILSEIIAQPKAAPPPPPPPAPPRPEVVKKAPPPRPLAIRDPVPTPNAPTGVVEPPPPAPPAPAPPAPSPPAPPAPVAPPAPPAPPAPKLVDVTEGQVQYISAPKVAFPSISRRLGESGKVVLFVYYSAAGIPKRVIVEESSGFDRLDKAAQEAQMQSRITPIQRTGANAETEFRFRATTNFVLN